MTNKFITDKTLPKEYNKYVVIAVKENGNINYHTAIYGIGGKGDKTFVLANDSIGRLYTIKQIEGYFLFDTL